MPAWPIHVPGPTAPLNTTASAKPIDKVLNKIARGGTYFVADVTERADLLTALDDAGEAAPSTSAPVLVFRADAPAGQEAEYTTDGTTWRTLAARFYAESTDFGTSPAGLWSHATSGATSIVRREGSAVWLRLVTRRSGAAAIAAAADGGMTDTDIFTIDDTRFRPAQREVTAFQYNSGGGTFGGICAINPDGRVRIMAGAPSRPIEYVAPEAPDPSSVWVSASYVGAAL